MRIAISVVLMFLLGPLVAVYYLGILVGGALCVGLFLLAKLSKQNKLADIFEGWLDYVYGKMPE